MNGDVLPGVLIFSPTSVHDCRTRHWIQYITEAGALRASEHGPCMLCLGWAPHGCFSAVILGRGRLPRFDFLDAGPRRKASPVPPCVSIESAHALCGPIALPTTFDAAQGHLARIGDSLTQIAQLEASAQSSYRVASLAPDLAYRRQRGASPGVLQGPLCHVLRLRLPIYSAPPSGPDQVGLGPLPLNTTW